MDKLNFIDVLVTETINKFRDERNVLLEQVAQGDLDLDDYRRNCGVMFGLQLAEDILRNEAIKQYKEE